MGLERNDLIGKLILCRIETIGGPSYFIDGEPVCFNRLQEKGKETQFCSHKAGYGTDHLGEGRCKFHRGNAGRPAINGRYAEIAKKKLAKYYQKFSEDPNILDLKPELVLLRSLLTIQIEEYQESPGNLNLKKLVGLLNNVSDTVETIEKIQSQQVITASVVRFMMAKAVEVAGRYLSGNELRQFIGEWKREVVPQEAGEMDLEENMLLIEGVIVEE